MFDEKSRNEIASYIEAEARDIVALREHSMRLIHDVIRELIQSRNEQLDAREDVAEKFAAVSIELSESIFNSCYNSMPMSAAGLIDWQINLLVVSSSILFDDSAYEAWQQRERPAAASLHQLVHDLHKRRCAIDPGALLKKAPPETLVSDFAAGHVGLSPDSIDYLYDMAVEHDIDDTLKWELKNLLVADAVILSQITLMFICFVASHAGARPSEVTKWMSAYNAMEDGILRLRSELFSSGQTIN